MLALRGIAKAYAKLAGIDLDVPVGDVVLLVGKNGAGKTTLLRIAVGYLDPDAGTVATAGSIGYLPEHAPVPVELTPREHLRLRARLKKATDVDRVIGEVDIADVADRPIGLLSKGYRQRVGLADALLGAPKLLVLDEPTGGLDPLQLAQFREIVAKQQAAVLISSHAVVDLQPIATRIVVLAGGKLREVEPGYRDVVGLM